MTEKNDLAELHKQIAKLVNSIYYMEFSDELGENVVRLLNDVDFIDRGVSDLYAIYTLPYQILRELNVGYERVQAQIPASFNPEIVSHIRYLAGTIDRLLMHRSIGDTRRVEWNPSDSS